MSHLTDKILAGFDSSLSTRIVLINLQKTFDAINSIMKNVFDVSSAQEVALWESYHSNRKL